MHRLYRERLNWTFFLSNGQAKVPKLREMESESAPYQIINTAINLQGSRYANKRGRNADFFMFTPRYVGSAATGYATTKSYQEQCPDLNLGTAMAISGAAASPGMGSNTLKLLAPTLAFLNVRLGYWIKNPHNFRREHGSLFERIRDRLASYLEVASSGLGGLVARRVLMATQAYFLYEALGLLDEESKEVYLSDGGHIDNLGLYELLRRNCRVILVVDAEADPELGFPSFIQVQRYARIDHGIRISVPIEPLRERNAATTSGLAGDGKAPAMGGPHCAVGLIHYDDDPTNDGVLLYVKSSLTGDESDYLLDYARRNPTFPHESTLDQIFSEEQFEAYRALGFHALHRALSGEDCIATHLKRDDPTPCNDSNSRDQPPNPAPALHKLTDNVGPMKRLRDALGLGDRVPTPSPPLT